MRASRHGRGPGLPAQPVGRCWPRGLGHQLHTHAVRRAWGENAHKLEEPSEEGQAGPPEGPLMWPWIHPGTEQLGGGGSIWEVVGAAGEAVGAAGGGSSWEGGGTGWEVVRAAGRW